MLTSVSVIPRPVWAAAPAEGATPLEQAKELYRRGVAEFDMANFDEAIDLWTKAYSLIDATPENITTRDALVYNVAKAQREAYKIDGDITRLKRAEQMLERSLQNSAEISDEADSEKLKRELDDLRNQISSAEGQGGASTDDTNEDAGSDDASEDSGATTQPPVDRGATDDGGGSGGKGLLIGGAVLAGLGVAGLGVMGAGLAMGSSASAAATDVEADPLARPDEIKKGKTGNALAFAGGIAGPVLLGAGVALIVVGIKKNKKSQSAWRVAPSLTRSEVGLMVGGAF